MGGNTSNNLFNNKKCDICGIILQEKSMFVDICCTTCNNRFQGYYHTRCFQDNIQLNNSNNFNCFNCIEEENICI